jgi:DNA-binding NtrC family response regulator
MHILLVDDDAGSLAGMQTALQILGHTCDTYSNPKDALLGSYGRVNEYGAVVTDFKMPEIDGISMVKRLTEEAPEMKVVVVSGLSKDRIKREAQKNGIVGEVISKPLNIIELSNALLKYKPDRMQKRQE